MPSMASLVIMIVTILANQLLYAQNSNAIRQFRASKESHPHNVAMDPVKNGPVWYTAQSTGELGKLNSITGKIAHIQLWNASGPHIGASAPHGVIIGPDVGLWITTNKWQEWKLPGDEPKPYAVYDDEKDKVWLSDFGLQNGKQFMVRFDPDNEKFEVIPLPSDDCNVRQIHAPAGQIWEAESGLDSLTESWLSEQQIET